MHGHLYSNDTNLYACSQESDDFKRKREYKNRIGHGYSNYYKLLFKKSELKMATSIFSDSEFCMYQCNIQVFCNV